MVFQQEVMVNLQIKPVWESHTASAENSLDLLSSNSLILGLVADNSWFELQYNFEYVTIILKLFKKRVK